MAIKRNPVKQLACKIVNLQAPTHSSDDEREESRFFAEDEPQHTKPAWLQKAGLEVKNIKDRLERSQREAKILAKLSHVRRPYPWLLYLARYLNNCAAKYHHPREGLLVGQYDVGLSCSEDKWSVSDKL